jgi:chromosome segregation ATPase
MKDLDEKMKAFGTPKEPSHEEHDKHLQEIEDEIQRLCSQRDAFKDRLHQRQSDLDAFRQSREESDAHGVNAEFQEAQRERDRLEKELRDLQALRGQKVEQLKDNKARLGVKNQDEALSRLAELDSQIETQTLTNTQLKKLLSEKDRIQSIFKSLEGFTKLQADVDTLRGQERDKRTELDAARDRFSKAREARNAAQGPKDQPSVSQRLSAELREIREQLDGVHGALKQKTQEKKTAREAFNNAWQEYRATLEEINKLGHEKRVIFSEAERVMMQIEEGRKRIGDIREFINPHETEINAGIALIAYLERFIEKQSEKSEARAPQPKVAGRDDLALLAALRKPTKKDREAAKKTQQQPQKPTTLSHDVTTLSQFDKVGLAAPLNIEQIPPLIEQLTAKVKAWREAFRCAKVGFNVQSDGKVTVAISVN